jgi:uracil-DNA glycosylase
MPLGKQGKSPAGAEPAGPGLARALEDLARRVAACRRCPRLVQYREEVARVKRKAYRECEYWGKPVPGFGDPRARLLVIGLAPAAHGGNRTGRIFTGDRSGDWLFRALHRAGLASQPSSKHRGDGLVLRGSYICAAVRCAPPANRPLPAEFENCHPYLVEEYDLLRPRAILALGGIAFETAVRLLQERGAPVLRPRPRFAHLARVALSSHHPVIVGSYHPSQQNTQTGLLTEEMLDAAVALAADAAGLS